MKLVILLLALLGTVVLDKLLALGMILLGAKYKGKRDGLDETGWNEWFRTREEKQLLRILLVVFIAAWTITTLALWGLLHLWGYRYAPTIAVLWLMARALGTWYRFRRGGTAYIQSKFAALRAPEVD